MAQFAPPEWTSLEDYLACKENAKEKHELFRGRVYAMAGGSANHGDIVVKLAQVCGRLLQGKKPCRFMGENQKVVVDKANSGYYPDGAIACPPNDLDRRRGTYDNPTVVFEVLSPSTTEFDRTDKYDDYRALSSLQDYVLIESERARVDVFSRLDDGDWLSVFTCQGRSLTFPPSRSISL